MKPMALNSTRNNHSSIMMSQLLNAINKVIMSSVKNENIITVIAVVCTLMILIGVALMNTTLMIISATLLVIAFAPVVVRWCQEDYNSDI